MDTVNKSIWSELTFVNGVNDSKVPVVTTLDGDFSAELVRKVLNSYYSLPRHHRSQLNKLLAASNKSGVPIVEH